MYKEPVHIDTIIDGCRKDDRRAQEQLYRSYYKAMMSMCIRYTKDETDARSVMNTGFLKVFKNIQQYDAAKATLYTWIRTIIVNSCLDHIKAKKKEITAQELDNAEESHHTEAEINMKMNTAEILHLIKGLPAATRAVFNLYVMDGYGHKEIAVLLDISEGTSKWHLSEARKNLKQQLMQKQHNI